MYSNVQPVQREYKRKAKMVKKSKRRGNPMVRAIVSKELEAKLRAMAKKERRTLSQMIALILERGVEK